MSSHTPTSPVPAYEAKPPQFPEHHSTALPMQDMSAYGTPTGQQQGGMIPHNYLQSQPQPISPLASPMQQPQATASGKLEYYSSAQQQQQPPPQQQQLPPQQYQQQQPQLQPQQSMYQTAVPLGNLQEAAAPVDCPVCRHRTLTIVEHVSGNTVHLWAALTCVVCCLGCIPYLISSIKDVQHKCGHCGVLLAEWKRSGRTVVLAHA